mmetsp:Transcript_26422/g.61481  ORF Transcript_26422/g.61481 Transcript_26422/m.61481 type:complete len:86 (+) Transcript_26422:776-1033(+)
MVSSFIPPNPEIALENSLSLSLWRGHESLGLDAPAESIPGTILQHPEARDHKSSVHAHPVLGFLPNGEKLSVAPSGMERAAPLYR